MGRKSEDPITFPLSPKEYNLQTTRGVRRHGGPVKEFVDDTQSTVHGIQSVVVTLEYRRKYFVYDPLYLLGFVFCLR